MKVFNMMVGGVFLIVNIGFYILGGSTRARAFLCFKRVNTNVVFI